MSVKLIWITPNAQDVISYCARVSNPSNQENYDTASRLLKYCAKNKHWSVFEQASMCIEVETTRCISQQILRHKLQAQEFSQRYASVENMSFEMPHLRRQDYKNRQNSIDDIPDINDEFRDRIEKHFNEGFQLYKDLLDKGVAKESARFVLPLSTKTRLYLSANIRNWIHYCQVRCDPSTQKEHREISIQIRDILFEQIPCLREVFEQ